MAACNELICALKNGNFDSALESLYAPSGSENDLNAARQRAIHLTQAYEAAFARSDSSNVALFSAPGRTEIGGNHTDHQHGHVLCASVNLDMLACAAPNGQNMIRIRSEGYPVLEVELDDLLPREEEAGSSAALVRGVAAKIVQRGYTVGGFDACITSDVLSGSGLSSSAAYEVLIGTILSTIGTLSGVEF